MWSGPNDDTICAISTPPGTGGIAVVRVSGPNAARVVRTCCPRFPEHPITHRVYLRTFVDPTTLDPIDETLMAFFAQGKSFTGEETVEISCHGGQVVTSMILESLISRGARLAVPGEFTARAFLNGKIDLAQAEGILQLIESQSKLGAKVALRQLQGDLSRRVEQIEDHLIWVMAQLEANIDFAAEDIVIAEASSLLSRLNVALRDIHALLDSYHRGESLRRGVHVVLVGAPNVGKSSLLNALLGQQRAIVTEFAGTTRDFVEGQRVLNGLSFVFVDTAGLRATGDPIEQAGISKTRERLAQGEVVIWVRDASHPAGDDEIGLELLSSRPIVVWNKCDTVENVDELRKKGFCLSALKGTGIAEFREHLVQHAQTLIGDWSETTIQARHFECLSLARRGVEAALGGIERGESPELPALELKGAVRAIMEVLGKQFDDQVLDRVFKEFCLGK